MSTEMELLVDLHRRQNRQGPGDDAVTLKAAELAGLDNSSPLTIADIGCGTGASSLALARALDAQITCVDFLPDFLEELQQRADALDLAARISTLSRAMDDLLFADETFDVIWSEGAIYNMGFEQGLKQWRRFLKPGGLMVVSEITWLRPDPPEEIKNYWQDNYPQIDTAANKIALLEQQGYSPVAYFVLPTQCWLENYYRPLDAQLPQFLDRHNHSDAAQSIAGEHKNEQALYEKYQADYSYGFYIARRID